MHILPLHQDLTKYLNKHQLDKKFTKQRGFLAQNPFYPSLHTEILEPRRLRLWSFRIDKRYRAIFIFREPDTIEVIDINDHYK